jgi:hypothetical protein
MFQGGGAGLTMEKERKKIEKGKRAAKRKKGGKKKIWAIGTLRLNFLKTSLTF